MDNEIEYCTQHLTVIPCYHAPNEKIEFTENLKRYDLIANLSRKQSVRNVFQTILIGIRFFFDKEVTKEIKYLFKAKNLSLYNLSYLMYQYIKGETLFRTLSKALDQRKLGDDTVFYSYWMNGFAYAAVKLARRYKNSVAITRGHGYDLYEYRTKGNYWPFRRFLLKHIKWVYVISTDGKQYLNERYPDYADKVKISRLGTRDYGISEVNTEEKIKVVSCSSVIDIKRVELIAQMLIGTGLPIEWTHFGEGTRFEPLKRYLKENPREGFTFVLRGRVNNRDIMSFYKDSKIDVFVNLSEHEGVPVSIMEALSFGIPVIATSVGGTGEIVKTGVNGYLLDVNVAQDGFNKAIRTLLAEKLNKKREEVRRTWLSIASADKNYRGFYDDIRTLD